MTDLTALTEITAPTTDDLVYVVDAPSGAKNPRKCSIANLIDARTKTLTNTTIDADGTGNSITNIENADIKSGAGIDATKIADGSVTNSEFKYINTLTDNAQTQIDGKSPLASPTFTGTVVLPNVPAIVTTQLDLKAPLASPTFTGTVTTASLDVDGNNVDNIQNLIHDLSTATTTLDFAGDELQEITISANTTFAASSNIAIGKSKTVIITTDSTIRTLAFPAGWKFIGSTPVNQAASKVGVLTLTCRTGIESGIICSYGVEE